MFSLNTRQFLEGQLSIQLNVLSTGLKALFTRLKALSTGLKALVIVLMMALAGCAAEQPGDAEPPESSSGNAPFEEETDDPEPP